MKKLTSDPVWFFSRRLSEDGRLSPVRGDGGENLSIEVGKSPFLIAAPKLAEKFGEYKSQVFRKVGHVLA
jgi:hypothetical protein